MRPLLDKPRRKKGEEEEVEGQVVNGDGGGEKGAGEDENIIARMLKRLDKLVAEERYALTGLAGAQCVRDLYFT